MASGRAPGQLSQLWQLPLLLVSLGLFAYAGYLFIDPRPGLSISQRISLAQAHLKNHRYEAAIEQCNKLLASEKLTPEYESRIHMLLAETLDQAQKESRISIPANYQQIIDQTRLALAEGAKASSDLFRRLGESYEALGQSADALDGYRRAMAMDPNRALPLRRKVIELQLMQDDTGPAETSIEDYLKDPKLSDSERAWALAQQAQALIHRKRYAEARPLLEQALKLDAQPLAQGVYHYHLGYCVWKEGDLPEAERILRVARDQLKVGHPLDAQAAYLLGQLRQEQNDPREAISFYESVLMTHPESAPAPFARLGRGVCRIAMNQDAGALSDLHDVTTQFSLLGSKAEGKSKETLNGNASPKASELLKAKEQGKAQVLAGLRKAAAALAARGNFQGALEVMADEQTLVPEPAPEFFGRLGEIYQKRADQVQATVAAAPTAAEQIKRADQVRELRTRAGDSYIALSRGLTLTDDRGHGEALWKGINLYDSAGALPQTISALELFVAERPDSGQAPDALLRLGRAYQAAGQLDKAIAAFQLNQFRYPQSLAASKSGVPLAEALIAKGPANYAKAQAVLTAVVENNPILTPDAEEFRQALLELSELFYRTGKYEEAIARLEEMTQRYPKDAQMAQLVFLMADSYRKSAGLLAEKQAPSNATPTLAALAVQAKAALTANPAAAAAAQAEARAARRDRLIKAKRLFDRVVDLFHQQPPTRDLDKLYLKLSHFYRADCLYDLGLYEKAIELYDAAALRYQDDPSSVSAYVQIVNAYCALGRMDDARAANERAKWLLKRMPAEDFEDGRLSMPHKYWDDWLKWTSESGMYKKTSPATRPVASGQ